MSHLALPNMDGFDAFEFFYSHSHEKRGRDKKERMRSRGESETDILSRRMGKSRSRILKTSVDYVVGYVSSCARTFTRAYSRCCKRTPLERVTFDHSNQVA